MSDTPNSPNELFRIFFRNTPRILSFQEQADIAQEKLNLIKHLEDEVVVEMKAKQIKLLLKYFRYNAKALDEITRKIDPDLLDDL